VCPALREKIARSVVALTQKYPELNNQLPMLSDKQPIVFGNDSLTLVFRKILRAFVSARPMLALLEYCAEWLERRYAHDSFLRPIYRWIVGGYIYQGYRSALQQYRLPPPRLSH
jgi:hypothetical protein